MAITWIITLFQLFAVFGVSVGSLQFTAVVPKTIYYDSPTVASVSAYGVESNSQATLTLEYKGRNGKILESTQLAFTSDGSKNWTVTFPWEGNGEKTVDLVMRSGQDSSISQLAFADNFGYIFVQTDKPVYVPGQTVKYRVIAVDEHQRQAKYKMRIDVKNPQQTIIDRRTTTAGEAFKTQELTLPKEASNGNWSITASFEGVDNMPRNVQTLTFEVKEFVLPRFYTELSISPKVITNETKNITLTGTARYYFNQPINGTADVQLGTWDNDNGLKFKKYLPGLKLNNGSFPKDVEVDKLQIDWQHLPKNMRLYVKMKITDAVTGEVDTFEDTSTFISYLDYIVEFAGSKGFFRPGFDYILQIQVLDIVKQPASEMNIRITTEYQIGQDIKKSISFEKLDRHGKKQLNITVPDNAIAITFVVSVANSKDFKHTIKKYDSKGNEYIHISLAAPIEKKKPGIVELKYTKPAKEDQNVGDRHDNVTVLVVSKGHIVFTVSDVKKSGGTFVQLPVHLFSMVTPRMRIIAYYYLPKTQEYVVDSLVVDTKPVCVEELTLSRIGSIYQPNKNLELEVDGGPSMRVGLVAVDKAVFALSRDRTHTLTRKMMFTKLGSHDSGTESGDGDSMENILSNSGLQHLSLTVKPTIHKSARGYHELDHRSPQGNGYLYDPPMGQSIGSPPVNTDDKMGDHSQSDTQAAMDQQLHTQNQHSPEKKQEDPPQTVRSYFPESWLFDDFELPSKGKNNLSNGIKILSLTLPGSITTWSFLAVGMSSTRGICVSEPEEVMVTKPSFADVKLPRKVKRLEKVTMHIVVYNNYPHNDVTGHVKVNGSDGLCFLDSPASGGNEIPTFPIHIQPYKFYKKTLQFIPMRIGDLKVFVDLQPQQGIDPDTVEKSLQVVAEGQKVKKSITFVLDPEAKNASVKSRGNRNSATVKNMYDPENKQQNTTINLSLPVEAIKGTEVCRISAFGDLMGDIINHSVLESKSLIDTTMGAEKVLGDLAPTVYALLYAKTSGLMDEKLRNRSRAFVRNGVISLLGYWVANESFALDPKSKPGTWLTAFVLKTLCQASSLGFIDQGGIINAGFLWLAKQVNEHGTVDEQDWRLENDSLEYRILLSAEVLIAILECNKSEEADLLPVQGAIFSFLEGKIEEIKEPMVLAKVTYAFMLSDDSQDEYIKAKEKLKSKKRRDKQDNYFWSSVEETNESKLSFWYDNGTHASAIEATAYALIIYLNDGDPDAEAIADWLVGQRNPNGAFIGAMDSAVAIQALAKYSYQKHGMKVDLCCNVSSDIQKNYFHSFKFTGENATHQKSLNDVPVGQVLDVQTKGQGLGQMQINVEYNIPINKNQKCPLMMTLKVTTTIIYAREAVNSNPLCTSCNIGCPKRNPPVRAKVKVSKSFMMKICKGTQPPYEDGSICNSLQKMHKRSSEKKEKRKKALKNKRGSRSLQGNQAVSRKSICINMCLQRRKKAPSDPTGVNIEMLTGYKPVVSDINKLKELPNVKQVVFDNTTETLRVQFTEISKRKKTCLAFRAVEEEEVDRLLPAVVEVKKPGTNTPLCVFEYHPPEEEESLQTYCAKNINGDKRECKCFSGQCAINRGHAGQYRLNELTEMVCASNIVYQLQFNNKSSSESCDEIDAEVISVDKTWKNIIAVRSKVKLSKSSFCACPKHRQDSSETIYVVGSTVEKHVDSQGHEVNQHVIDKQSTFLQLAGESSSKDSLFGLAIKHCHG